MFQKLIFPCFFCSLLVFIEISNSAGEDWPSFRGPTGNGISKESEFPRTWSATHGVQWKVKMPKPGNGSPVVSQGRVFVACAEDDDGKERSLFCLNRKNGQLLWKRTEDLEKKMPTHNTNMYCGTTPAVAQGKVVVWHATAGLFCYGIDGKPIWSHQLGEFKHIWGYGTSPVIHDGKVILHSGPGAKTFVACYQLDTGKELWKTEEKQTTDGNTNEKNVWMGSWCTPVILKSTMRTLIICGMSTRVVAYDLADGSIVWYCKGTSHDRGDLQYSSPVIANDICFITGGYNGPAFAFQMKGSGDITKTGRLWRTEKNPQSIGSGVEVDGYIYRPNAGPATIECIDPKTGEVQWKSRGAGANSWGSIVKVGDHLLLTSQNGSTVIFKPNPKRYEEVAVNKLGERCNSTPAISNGQIFIRTFDSLYCIGG